MFNDSFYIKKNMRPCFRLTFENISHDPSVHYVQFVGKHDETSSVVIFPGEKIESAELKKCFSKDLNHLICDFKKKS